MWIEELDIRGFKRLSGLKRFDRGLNLVLGPNESGKSTLHEAILRSLYGFDRSERRRRDGVSWLDRCAPWQGDEFSINAVVHARTNRYRIEWDFSRLHLVLSDASTGEDLSDEVRRPHDEVRLGEFLLGLGAGEFRSVCCLGQEDLATVDKTEDLVLALQRAVEVGAAHSGVEQAVGLLNSHLRESVGVRVDNLRPNRGGALAVAEGLVEGLAARLSVTEDARQGISELAEQLIDAEAAQAGAEHSFRHAEQRDLVDEADRLAARLESARTHQSGLAVEPAGGDVDPGLVERAEHLRASRTAATGRVEELEAEAARQAPTLAEKEAQRRSAQAEVDALAPYRDVDLEGEDKVRELAGQLEGIDDGRPIEGRPDVDRDPALARYRAQRRELAALAGAETAAGRIEPVRAVAAIALAAISVVLAVLVQPVAIVGLALSLAVLFVGRGAADDGSTGLEAALREYEATSLDELDERVAEEDRRVAAQSALNEERRRRETEAETTRARLDERLRAVLDRCGATPLDDLRGRAQAYLAACGSRRAFDSKGAVVAGLDVDLGVLRQPARDLAEKRRERDEMEGSFLGVLRELGLEVDSAGDGIERLGHLRAALAEHARVTAQAAQAQAALEAVLQGATLEELERQVRLACDARDAHIARHGSVAVGPSSGSGDVEGLRAAVQDASLRAGELATVIGEREAALEEPAVLREELERARERCGRLERNRDAVVLAREVLEEAARQVHRVFAPHLNEALEEGLPRITGGRYGDAVVAEDLSIRVKAPETGRLVPASDLSRGSQSQIYLVERLAMTQLLDATTDGAPLLLDDPFARFDDDRRRHGLELLADMAGSRQVILFSDDPRLMDELADLGAAHQLIELAGTVAAAQGEPAE